MSPCSQAAAAGNVPRAYGIAAARLRQPLPGTILAAPGDSPAPRDYPGCSRTPLCLQEQGTSPELGVAPRGCVGTAGAWGAGSGRGHPCPCACHPQSSRCGSCSPSLPHGIWYVPLLALTTAMPAQGHGSAPGLPMGKCFQVRFPSGWFCSRELQMAIPIRRVQLA